MGSSIIYLPSELHLYISNKSLKIYFPLVFGLVLIYMVEPREEGVRKISQLSLIEIRSMVTSSDLLSLYIMLKEINNTIHQSKAMQCQFEVTTQPPSKSYTICLTTWQKQEKQ